MPDLTPQLTVILPTYNEAGNILDLLRDIDRAIPEGVEVIVVDDHSPDGTAGIAQEYALRHPQVRVIQPEGPAGLTRSISTGIAAAATPLVGWMDADGSMPAETLAQLQQAVLAGADAAVGSRYVPGGGDIRGTQFQTKAQILLSRTLSLLGRRLLHPGFHDWSSGFIVLRRSLLEGHELRGDYGEYFIDLIHHLLHHRNAVVTEVPYVLGPRRHGESKTATHLAGLVRRGRKYLATLWRLYHCNS